MLWNATPANPSAHLQRPHRLGRASVGTGYPAEDAQTSPARTAPRSDGPRKVDDADAAKARQLREKGIAATDIAKMLRSLRATVYRYLTEDGAA